MTALLQVSAISKTLGRDSERTEIIGSLDLTVHEGEFVAIVGPSGCGKTTLLMCLAGLFPVDKGTVQFAGQVVRQPPPGLSVVFQDYSRSLLPWKSTLDNVVFGMKRIENLDTRAKRAKAGEYLAAVGLAGFERHYPWQLSGGMQQRVAIARGLAAESRLLLLDEPLAAVDAQTRSELQDLLLQLARQYKQACLLVTHDVDEAVYMADRVLVLTHRPTSVREEIEVRLPKPRDQITTRSHPRFIEVRNHVIELIRSPSKPQAMLMAA